MSRSNWGYKSGLVVIAIISIAVWTLFVADLTHRKTENDVKTNHDASHYAKHTKSQIQSLCSGVDSPSLAIDCAVSKYEASRDAERGENDLGAQQSMSEWAYLMVLVSGATTIITAIGAYFVWGTLRETRVIGQAQVRAYLSFSVDEFDMTEDGIKAKWSMVNSGQTPAKNVSFKQVSVAEPEPFDEALHICKITDTASVTEIPAGGKKTQTVITPSKKPDVDGISKQDMIDVLSEAKSFWICFYVSYEDAFGREFYTKCRYKLGKFDDGWNMYVTPDGNKST